MAEIDLSNLNVPELHALKEAIEFEIEKRQTQNKLIVLDQIKELAQSIGMTVEDIIGISKKTPKRSALSRSTLYVNPENPKQSWSGRGRRPNWAKELLSRGGTLGTEQTR